MTCIEDKKVTPRARKEIIQTLVTLLITKVGSNHNRSQCETVARRLILKYPFMRDDIGTGYVSILYMLERVPIVPNFVHYCRLPG